LNGKWQLYKYELLTNLVQSRWMDIGQVLFLCVFMDRDRVEVQKHAKNERGKNTDILTEHGRSKKDF